MADQDNQIDRGGVPPSAGATHVAPSAPRARFGASKTRVQKAQDEARRVKKANALRAKMAKIGVFF